ncbi:hypothetical protein ACIQK6_43000 [Streptomyces sp. NPDC091682]|uniref:hypothetical protein n=1 Tax=Streptomyces sp. NPDC091682 TaxID=3366005 RepID=UPI003805C8CE
MDPDAELTALATQEDLPADLVWRLLSHPGARRTAALLRRDLTEEMIEEIIGLGSARTLAANAYVPPWLRIRFVEHLEPAVRSAVAASVTRTSRPGRWLASRTTRTSPCGGSSR